MKFKVSGESRTYPTVLWEELEGPKPPPPFESDGCSCSPDDIVGIKLWPACHIHDYHYREGVLSGTWAGRREADQILRRNLAKVIAQQEGGKAREWFYPYIYWGRVRIHGASSYRHWDAGERPESLWHRFVEGWGWFRDKREENVREAKSVDS